MIRSASSASIICARVCVCVCVCVACVEEGGLTVQAGRSSGDTTARGILVPSSFAWVSYVRGQWCVCLRAQTHCDRLVLVDLHTIGIVALLAPPTLLRGLFKAFSVKRSERWPNNTNRLNALARMCSCMRACMRNHWQAGKIARSTLAELKLNQMEKRCTQLPSTQLPSAAHPS